jgi:hypothetical protein
MILDDAACTLPENGTKVWRYVDFARFVSILDSSSLWFARLDTFGDSYEGATSIPAFAASMDRAHADGHEWAHNPPITIALMSSLMNAWLLSTFANCWNVQEGESLALWKIYGTRGLAIQSSIARLKATFDTASVPEVRIGQVRYTDDPEGDENGGYGPFWNATTKRSIYDYEREVRVIRYESPLPGELPAEEYERRLKAGGFPVGHSIRVDLSQLIERVYLAPDCPSWLPSLVRSLLGRYNLTHVETVLSSVISKPAFFRDPKNIGPKDYRAEIGDHLSRQQRRGVRHTKR